MELKFCPKFFVYQRVRIYSILRLFESLRAPSLKHEPPWVVTGPVLYTINLNLYHSWMKSTAVLPQHLVYPVHIFDKEKYFIEIKDHVDYARYKDAYVAHLWNIVYWQ